MMSKSKMEPNPMERAMNAEGGMDAALAMAPMARIGAVDSLGH